MVSSSAVVPITSVVTVTDSVVVSSSAVVPIISVVTVTDSAVAAVVVSSTKDEKKGSNFEAKNDPS